jgi:hypothetical protein
MAEEKPIKIERQEIDKPSLEREGSVDDEKSALELKHKNEREELGNRLQKSKSAAGFLVILLVAPARVVGGLLVGEGDVKHFARDGFYFLYQAPSVSQKSLMGLVKVRLISPIGSIAYMRPLFQISYQ